MALRSTRDGLTILALLTLVFVPTINRSGSSTTQSIPLRPEAFDHKDLKHSKRDTSPVDVCFRFSGQTAVVNGTLYLYGGQAASQQGQTENTWTNDFYSLDLTKSWQISSPALTGLPQPSGVPAVALGTLWSSRQSLYLYGGEYSWKPPVTPAAFSLWEYNIQAQSWAEHQNPQTSDGTNAPMNNGAVQRAAEGAAANVPELGRGFYFGGHLDGYTTQGWSQSTPRLYLQSLLEFTFPGYANDQVNALSNGRTAGTYGNYRNITKGGVQSTGGFTVRADGLLVFVPGFGKQGVLIALAGGTNETFTQMNSLDVYDIATSTWYKQSTAGSYPTVRVNPCAVVAAAADASSFQIHMFGGQNLVPYANQTQFSDMWILSVPSFTWIQVDQSKQSVPYGRSGHTCNIWDGQMVMIGGYTGTQLSCESPGIYVFDASSLAWTSSFVAKSSDETSNPFSQQSVQRFNSSSGGGLDGSYGYEVPEVVRSIIGGGPSGGATLTTPLITATAGPMATGSPVTYTVTGASGATTTETVGSGPSPTGSTSSSSGSSGPNVGAIVAGVIAGLLFLLVCYLLFCTYLYRKQLQLYKRHAEMAQRQTQGEKASAAFGPLLVDSRDSGSETRQAKRGHFSWSAAEHSSRHDSGQGRFDNSSNSAANSGYQVGRRSGSSEDLLAGNEPSFVGVLLNPRRSLRVINSD